MFKCNFLKTVICLSLFIFNASKMKFDTGLNQYDLESTQILTRAKFVFTHQKITNANKIISCKNGPHSLTQGRKMHLARTNLLKY